MPAHMPAIEITFGETFREASHVVADCAHLRFRVAIGRRSIACGTDSFIADAIHSRNQEERPDKNSRRVAQSPRQQHPGRSPLASILSLFAQAGRRDFSCWRAGGSAPLLRSVRYFEMMQQHAYDI